MILIVVVFFILGFSPYQDYFLWREWDLNPRPAAYESVALPTELPRLSRVKFYYNQGLVSIEKIEQEIWYCQSVIRSTQI